MGHPGSRLQEMRRRVTFSSNQPTGIIAKRGEEVHP